MSQPLCLKFQLGDQHRSVPAFGHTAHIEAAVAHSSDPGNASALFLSAGLRPCIADIDPGFVHRLPDQNPVGGIRRENGSLHHKLFFLRRKLLSLGCYKLQLPHRNPPGQLRLLPLAAVIQIALLPGAGLRRFRRKGQLRGRKPPSRHREGQLSRLGGTAHHDQQLAREQLSHRSLVVVVIRAVAVIHSKNPSRPGKLCLHIIRCVLHGIALPVHRRNRDKAHILAVCPQPVLIHGKHNPPAVPEGDMAVPGPLHAVFVVGHRGDGSGLIRHLPLRNQLQPMGMIDELPASGLPVDEQFHPGQIGTRLHINDLSRIEIPMGEQMNHGRFLPVRPLRLEHIVGILRKACRVNLSEIGIFRMVGRGLPDIIKPGPDKLSPDIFRVSVVRNTLLPASRPPAGIRISKG